MPRHKIVYLMRGLPACGKSHTAKQLAGQTGTVLETHRFFYEQVGDDPANYDYRKDLMPEARRWNFERFKNAVDQGVSPIVVDRGNGLNVVSAAGGSREASQPWAVRHNAFGVPTASAKTPI